jgi:hypothetical protein
MGPPRFRLRTLLASVALIALALWYAKARERWPEYRKLAREHAREEERCVASLPRWRAMKPTPALSLVERDRVIGEIEIQAAYHSRMRREYESRW